MSMNIVYEIRVNAKNVSTNINPFSNKNKQVKNIKTRFYLCIL